MCLFQVQPSLHTLKMNRHARLPVWMQAHSLCSICFLYRHMVSWSVSWGKRSNKCQTHASCNNTGFKTTTSNIKIRKLCQKMYDQTLICCSYVFVSVDFWQFTGGSGHFYTTFVHLYFRDLFVHPFLGILDSLIFFVSHSQKNFFHHLTWT